MYPESASAQQKNQKRSQVSMVVSYITLSLFVLLFLADFLMPTVGWIQRRRGNGSMLKKVLRILCFVISVYLMGDVLISILPSEYAILLAAFMPYIIGVCVLNAILGFVTKSISESKGYEGGFWWGFLLGILGIIVVAVRPTLPDESTIMHERSSTMANYTTALEQLARLKDQGILTEEEYNQKKQKILSQI